MVFMHGQMVLTTKGKLIKIKSKAREYTYIKRQIKYSLEQIGVRIKLRMRAQGNEK